MVKRGRPKKPKNRKRVQISIRVCPETLRTLKKGKINIGRFLDKACQNELKKRKSQSPDSK